MLDALSDFWKPMKKSNQEKLQVEQLQIGSAIVFGFVPQASLSGHRLQIASINTYQFGNETLTSFVLNQDRDPGISMIVAESEGEQYLAISRRVTISDRIKMFDSQALEDVTEKADVTKLACKENPDFKGWTVANYRREIHGMKGRIYAGDFRKTPLPAASSAQEFKYTLLASDNNEHAIEIEKYPDGRIEMYATVYRRTSDIGEVSHPLRPDLRLTPKTEQVYATAKPAEPKKEETKPAEIKQPFTGSPIKATPPSLQEFPSSSVATTELVKPPPAQQAPASSKPVSPSTPLEPKEKTMSEPATAMQHRPVNGPMAPKLSSVVSQPAANESYKQEVIPVNKNANGVDNESVECDLRVANKIIDEAIRNEMRLSDVVRRIIELPVADQQSVQIPITLTEEDYSLLAIRYGISSSDKAAIKARIIEDLNDFSGNSGQKKAA